MLLWQRNLKFSASTIWGCSTFVRSNGIVLCGFPIYSLVVYFIKVYAYRNYNRKWFWKEFLASIFQIALVVIPFISFQYAAFTSFCGVISYRPWCDSWAPSIYSFVQSHYWNNGFLRYFTAQQIPNFFLASPMLFLAVFGFYMFFKSFKSVRILIDDQKSPYFLMWFILSLICFTSFHVQIITRFISFVPPLYWSFSRIYNSSSNLLRLVLIFYLLVFSMTGSVLFSLFYPPA